MGDQPGYRPAKRTYEYRNASDSRRPRPTRWLLEQQKEEISHLAYSWRQQTTCRMDKSRNRKDTGAAKATAAARNYRISRRGDTCQAPNEETKSIQ